MRFLLGLGIHFGVLAALVTAMFLVAPRFVPRLKIKATTQRAIIAAVAFAAANVLIGPIIAFAIGVLSAGLLLLLSPIAAFISNVILLYAADHFIDDFEIEDMTSLFSLAGIITVVSFILSFVR
jgi:uncharacterized membrane protein YvlD (DUF360 family)